MSIPAIPSATPFPYRVSPTDWLYSSLLRVLYRKQLFSCTWNTKEYVTNKQLLPNNNTTKLTEEIHKSKVSRGRI